MDVITLTAIATGVFLIAGTMKGVVGIGLPTTSIGVLTLFVDPRLAITLTLLPVVGSNAWQVLRAGQILRTARRYWIFAVVLFIGVGLTALASRTVPDRVLFGVLGVGIVTFVILNLLRDFPAIPDRFDRMAQVICGAVTGVMGGLAAVWAPPMIMYLTGRQVDKDEFVRATGLLIFIGCIPLVWGYMQIGLLDRGRLGLSAAMLIPTIAGFSIGEKLRHRLSIAAFRKATLYVFLLLGLNLLRRAIW